MFRLLAKSVNEIFLGISKYPFLYARFNISFCLWVSIDDVKPYPILLKKGKEQEALQSTTQADLFMASKLEGLKYKVDILLDFTEAYKILGMAPPEEV